VFATRTLALALAATGRCDEARTTAAAAAYEAYATQQRSERAAADDVRAKLNSQDH
jgi:hypothetical protein